MVRLLILSVIPGILFFDDTTRIQTSSRPAFIGAKRKLLWMQNGGKEGLELDDIRVESFSKTP